MQDIITTTVVTPAASNNLTTLANVKADLNISSSAEDSYLTRLIAQVSASIYNYCNRIFAQQTYQDVWQPRRYQRSHKIPDRGLYMPARLPLVSVTSVTEDGTLLVVNTDYELNLDGNAIYRLDSSGNPTDWPGLSVTFVYVAGYGLPAASPPTPLLPADVEDAAIRMIKGRRAARTRDSYLKGQEIAGVGREEYWVASGANADGNMTPDVTDILNNYRLQTLS